MSAASPPRTHLPSSAANSRAGHGPMWELAEDLNSVTMKDQARIPEEKCQWYSSDHLLTRV
jgi:hypothetical protein